MARLILSPARFFHRHLLWRLLSDQAVIPWLTFWARLVLRLRRPIIVGVTGTVGKTTTLEMIMAVLRHPAARPIVGEVGQAMNNLNNDRCLPMAVLQFERRPIDPYVQLRQFARAPLLALKFGLSRRYPRVLVLEYGAGWGGHLHRLARLFPPQIGIVTIVGPGHLERFRTVEGVAREKSAIPAAVPPSGLVILGTGHDHVELLRAQAKAPVVTVDSRGIDLARDIARVVGRRFGVPEPAIEAALAGFKPPKQRLNRFDAGDLTVIDDSYNANPLSMKLGLGVLAETAAGRRRVAVLGAMAELGDEAARFHREIGDYARERSDLLIGVGEPARDYQPDHWFATSTDCADRIDELLRPGDILLVKGSGSVEMGRVADRLRENASHVSPRLKLAAAG
jgi:UDP-N-acetylmuramoyl-tripeptide--D-alanyl-D-alanine ligase